MFIQYGVKITTKQTTLTDYSLGLIDGVLKWATGREDLGEFKNGILLEDSLSPVSQAVEIAAGGSYGTLSAFSLKIDNATGLADAIRDLGLNLSQADTVFYSFRRETEADPWVATADWPGKVLDWSRDENEIEIKFMDSFRGIHKPVLKTAISISEFPKAPSESIGKFIPVSIGRVAHAKLLNIQDDTEKIVCATVSGQGYKFCAATEYPVGSPDNFRVIKIKTEDEIFAANSLIGHTLSVIYGGVNQSRMITANGLSSSGETSITINLALDLSTAFVPWSSVNVTNDVWYFEITNNKSNFAVSANEISSFVSPDTAINSFNSFVEIFKSATKKFSKILGIDFTKSLSDVDGTGYPGFSLLTKSAGSDGKATLYTAVKPSDIVVTAKNYSGSLTSSTDGLGSPLSNPSNLIDRLHSSGYSFAWSIANTVGWAGPVFDITYEITIPQDVLEEDFSDIFVLPDFLSVYGGAGVHYVYMTISSVDFYGRDPVPVVPEFEISASFGEHNFLHENYFSVPTGIIGIGNHFGGAWSPGVGYATLHQFSAKGVISNAAKLGIYDKFSIKFRVTQQDGIGAVSDAAVDFREIGLISAYDFNLSKENFYIKILGETFGSTWDGRKTAAEPIQNIAEVIEAMFRNFDNAPEFVDTASFDIVGNATTGLLKDFYVGQQIEEINSAEIIDELCRYSFTGLVPKNNGKKALKSWMDGNVVATHTDTNGTINKGSIGVKAETSLSDLFNEPQVNYGWNPASEKFDALLRITKIDEDEFPLEATLDANGIPLWKSFAIGYDDSEYDEAKDNWDPCHLSWTKYGFIRPLPKSMSDAKWFPNIETDWGLSATYNAAKAYMRKLCRWTPFRKDVIPYNLPNTATHAGLELLDRIAFSDSTDRDGAEFEGVIVEKTIVPGLGKDYIEIQLMLDPDLGGLA